VEVDTYTDSKYFNLMNGFNLNTICYWQKFEGFHALILSHLIKLQGIARCNRDSKKEKKHQDPMPGYSR
jgi:hypothetical protein